MTILEKQSLRKKKSILYLVSKGEYSVGYAMLKVEELYDNGKLTDDDYNELADYLDELMNQIEAEAEKPFTEETTEEQPTENEEEVENVE